MKILSKEEAEEMPFLDKKTNEVRDVLRTLQIGECLWFTKSEYGIKGEGVSSSINRHFKTRQGVRHLGMEFRVRKTVEGTYIAERIK